MERVHADSRSGNLPIGYRSGKLVVVAKSPTTKGRSMWLCRCDCGSEIVRTGHILLRKEVKSCGCLRRQRLLGNPNYKHGHTAKRKPTQIYISWLNMCRRCVDSNRLDWKYYGGRGIRVCERWLGEHGFTTFLADMGTPKKGETIDRIDNDGNYEPGNCRWASRKQQRANQKPRTKRQ